MGRNSKNKIGLQFNGYKELTEELDRLGGDLKKTTERALVQSKAYVTKNLLSVTHKQDYPAGGKYSTGKTRHSIDTSKTVQWNGSEGSIDVGFDIDKGGLTSIFLMYGTKVHGTPRMKPVKGMYEAVYGKDTQAKIRKIQKQVFDDAIKERLK